MAQFRQVSTGVLLAWVLAALPAGAASPRGQSPYTPPPVVEHKVTRGETLWSISQKHHTSVGAVMDYNHLSDHNVREGMVLRIPPKVVITAPAPRHRKHVVKRGEDFWDVAHHYDMKSSELAKANPNVNPNRIHSGMELIIPVREEGDKSTRKEPVAPRQQPNAPNLVQHTVGEDETFYSISRRYKVGMDAVVAANPDVRPERLRQGMKVWVPGKKSATAAALVTAPLAAQQKPAATTVANTGSKSTRSHVIKENESIATIAKKYGVSETALLRENKLSEDDAIYVDETLKIPTSGATAASSQTVKQTKLTATAPKPSTAAAAPSPQPKATPSTASNVVGSDGAIRSYIVSAGEDENTICDAFGISKKALFDYNHLSSTTKLKPGDEIAIPRVSKARKR